MKEKIKKGLFVVAIINSSEPTQFYYVKPNVKFKMIESEYKLNFPDRSWLFLYNGLYVDSEKTLEELKFKKFSKIVADEFM